MPLRNSTEDQTSLQLPAAWEHWVISISLLAFSLAAVVWASLLTN